MIREAADHIVEASRKPELLTTRWELGIAIPLNSHNSCVAYQDVSTSI